YAPLSLPPTSVSLFLLQSTPPTLLSTLSLHDALPIFATIRSSENPSTTAIRHPCPALYGTGPAVHVTCGRVTRVTPPRAPTCKEDRKSTRLNSSHVSISYAVFCLKKKTSIPPEATSTT